MEPLRALDRPVEQERALLKIGADGGIKVFDRIILLLDQFTPAEPELGIVQLARATGLTKSTVHRLLAALEQHRLVEQDVNTRKYRLGMRLFELGSRAVARIDVPLRANSALTQLVAATGETCNIGILDRGQILYVAKVDGWHSLRMPSEVGTRLDAHCTALGKVLISHLPEAERRSLLEASGMPAKTHNTMTDTDLLKLECEGILARGYSVDDEELELGVRCIAAPVFDYSGKAVAAVSLSGPVTRITPEKVCEMAEQVVACARQTSKALGALA
jgi:DNA-binding IclR family transcriptional regulator